LETTTRFNQHVRAPVDSLQSFLEVDSTSVEEAGTLRVWREPAFGPSSALNPGASLLRRSQVFGMFKMDVEGELEGSTADDYREERVGARKSSDAELMGVEGSKAIYSHWLVAVSATQVQQSRKGITLRRETRTTSGYCSESEPTDKHGPTFLLLSASSSSKGLRPPSYRPKTPVQSAWWLWWRPCERELWLLEQRRRRAFWREPS